MISPCFQGDGLIYQLRKPENSGYPGCLLRKFLVMCFWMAGLLKKMRLPRSPRPAATAGQLVLGTSLGVATEFICTA